MKNVLGGGLLCLVLVSASAVSYAQEGVKQNQTLGYGDGKLLKFTYSQSFDCVDQPKDDLDFNKVQAQADPNEFQVPICQAGIDPTINPPGQVGHATMT